MCNQKTVTMYRMSTRKRRALLMYMYVHLRINNVWPFSYAYDIQIVWHIHTLSAAVNFPMGGSLRVRPFSLDFQTKEHTKKHTTKQI